MGTLFEASPVPLDSKSSKSVPSPVTAKGSVASTSAGEMTRILKGMLAQSELAKKTEGLLNTMLAVTEIVDGGVVTDFDEVTRPTRGPDALYANFEGRQELFLCQMVLVERFLATGIPLTARNIDSILLSALITATKTSSDFPISNASFAEACKLPLPIIHKHEQQFLEAIDFRCIVSPEEVADIHSKILAAPTTCSMNFDACTMIFH